MKYVLKPVTSASLAVIAGDWQSAAGSEEFQIELASAFDFAHGHTDEVLDLFNTENGNTDALLEVVTSKHASMSKLLKLWISPKFWAIESKELRRELVELHASAFSLMIARGIDSDMNTVKLFGRTEAMLDVLHELAPVWDTFNTGWSAKIQGRWLSITKD